MFNNRIIKKLNKTLRYFDELIEIERTAHDDASIWNQLNSSNKKSLSKLTEVPSPTDNNQRRAFFMNGQFNYHSDIQDFLKNLYPKLSRFDRVYAVTYNPYLYSLFSFYNKFRVKKIPTPTTFLTRASLHDVARVAGFELVQVRPVLFWGIDAIPFIRNLAWKWIVVLRPIKKLQAAPKLSIVIPARNESGNIENAITQLPKLNCPFELIFVEGNSTDDTWNEILRVQKKYENQFEIKIAKQTGKGKNNAVRKGFEIASGDLLTILDADLTMPPEKLPLFVDAFLDGHGDFINGDRLVYPMENNAMRFLNRLGNIFFAKALSFTLDTRLGDSLCGTKMFTKRDYERIVRWRGDFGDFDPFGDFEFLFGATILNLGIVDMPIRYKERVYGETNIHRFRHGFQLLRMTLIGLFRIRA